MQPILLTVKYMIGEPVIDVSLMWMKHLLIRITPGTMEWEIKTSMIICGLNIMMSQNNGGQKIKV